MLDTRAYDRSPYADVLNGLGEHAKAELLRHKWAARVPYTRRLTLDVALERRIPEQSFFAPDQLEHHASRIAR